MESWILADNMTSYIQAITIKDLDRIKKVTPRVGYRNDNIKKGLEKDPFYNVIEKVWILKNNKG